MDFLQEPSKVVELGAIGPEGIFTGVR